MDQECSKNIYQPLMLNPKVPIELSNIGSNQDIPPSTQRGFMISNPGLKVLESLDGIFVKQKIEMAEIMFGVETRNKYYVHALSHTGKKKKAKLFKCKEKSDYCVRACCGASRPFKMDIYTLKNKDSDAEEDEDQDEPFLTLDRPYKCTCYCLARPELTVTLNGSGQDRYIGKIVEPFTCCNMVQYVFDEANKHKYTIFGSCKQWGFWCKGPCEPCQTVDFSIQTIHGEIVGHLQKRSQGIVEAMVSDADAFAINFPPVCTVYDKALLMSAVLFTDFNYFERKPRRMNNSVGQGVYIANRVKF